MTRQKNGTWKLTDSEMNLFAIFAFEASERYTALGCTALSKEAAEKQTEIHNILNEAGFYKDCE